MTPWQPRRTRAAPQGETPRPGGAAPMAQGAALRAAELPANRGGTAKSRERSDGDIKQRRRHSPDLCVFGVGVPMAVSVSLWGGCCDVPLGWGVLGCRDAQGGGGEWWQWGNWTPAMGSRGHLRGPNPFWGDSEGSSTCWRGIPGWPIRKRREAANPSAGIGLTGRRIGK